MGAKLCLDESAVGANPSSPCAVDLGEDQLGNRFTTTLQFMICGSLRGNPSGNLLTTGKNSTFMALQPLVPEASASTKHPNCALCSSRRLHPRQ